MIKKPLLFLPLFALACSAPNKDNMEDVVNVYTHRHYETDKALFALFEKESGIKVNVVMADDDELLSRLDAEGANSPADVIITADAGRLGLAEQRGFLKPIHDSTLEANVPAHLRDPEGNWFGFTMRARVVAYDKNKVAPEELMTYADLCSPRFKGQILVRPSEHVYNQSLVAAMIAHFGIDSATSWCKGIVANMARDPKGSDTDQLLAIGEGLGSVAIVNSYYIGKLMKSDDPARQKAKNAIAVAFPLMQNDREGEVLTPGIGTHVNISGGGVAAHAKHEANAIALLRFLSSDASQAAFADGNMEYPVKPGIPAAAVLQGFGRLIPDTLDLSELGRHNAEAVKALDAAGWR
ncbi:MAG: Fe(3+) ABC transporter substrate-binding protein [Flavobacteriales bacterium]|nr:Fe(3+) ABC transporter substrate-binding protein [Flavobacteriales bacterium]